MRLINNADYIIKSQVKFGALVREYREKHLTQLGYAQQCKFEWAHKKHTHIFDNFSLSEMTTRTLQDWFNSKQGELSKSSRIGLRNILSGIFERGIAWGLFTASNPVHGLKIFGGNEHEKNAN